MKIIRAIYCYVRRSVSCVLPAVLCLCVTVLSPAVSSYAAPRDVSVALQDTSDDADRIDISIKSGYIYVTTQRATTLRLYSILGQLIMTHNLQAGTTRIKAPSRGVYIMKAGSVTRRLTVN